MLSSLPIAPTGWGSYMSTATGTFNVSSSGEGNSVSLP